VILVGELSLWVALLMAAWAATVSFAGGQLRRSGEAYARCSAFLYAGVFLYFSGAFS
jgi:hypothetical protein